MFEPLLRIVAPDLPPDLAGEGGERQDVVAGLVQVGGGGGQLGLERGDDLGVLGADRGRVGLLEDGADQGGDPRLGGLGHPGEQVAVVVRPAPLPGGAGQHRGDRVHQAGVVVAGHQLHAGQAAGDQAAQERQPPRAVLGAGHVDAEDLPVPRRR